MTAQTHSFKELLQELINKSSFFTPKETDALVSIVSHLIGSPSFSLKKVAKNSNGKFCRNFLAKTLKKYAYVQHKLIKLVVAEFSSLINKHDKIFLLLDDTLISKHGTRIFGAFKWYDHSQNRTIQSICIMNLAFAIKDQLVFIMPWMILETKKWSYSKRKRKLEQDSKTTAAIQMITLTMSWFQELNIRKKRIIILADSWFSNKNMVSFIKESKLKYRLDLRKNLRVQLPDHEAIKKKNEHRRGRKRSKFVKYKSLVEYFGKTENWSYFTDSSTEKQIYYKTSVVTLKTLGRVRVYAYYQESHQFPKFIAVPAQLLSKPSPKTVHKEYATRWRIEEAHRDLKQQFGLTKSQNRDGWVVSGFIGLVCLAYSQWKQWAFFLKEKTKNIIKCPTWSENFYIQQIIKKFISIGS